MITFSCPNGHSLSCSEDRAGHRAKCPKCQAEVVVPTTDRSGDTTITKSNGESQHANAEGVVGDMIVFLCPNGHKLNGPASLQGRPGQCPHCGSRFIVPNYDDVEEIDEFAGDSEDAEYVDDVDVVEEVTSVPPPEDTDRVASFVNWLWDQKDDQQVLEVEVSDGEVLRPTSYSAELSDGDYGVFATKDEIGTFTVTVVRWDRVTRVSLRNVADIPEEYFH